MLEGVCSDDQCRCGDDCEWSLPHTAAAVFIAALAAAAPEALGPDPRLFGKLHAVAGRLGLRHHPVLEAAIARPLPDPAPPSLLVALASYLDQPEPLLRVFGRPDAATALLTALRENDNAEWIFVVQEFYPVAETSLPPSLHGAAFVAQVSLGALDEGVLNRLARHDLVPGDTGLAADDRLPHAPPMALAAAAARTRWRRGGGGRRSRHAVLLSRLTRLRTIASRGMSLHGTAKRETVPTPQTGDVSWIEPLLVETLSEGLRWRQIWELPFLLSQDGA